MGSATTAAEHLGPAAAATAAASSRLHGVRPDEPQHGTRSCWRVGRVPAAATGLRSAAAWRLPVSPATAAVPAAAFFPVQVT